MLNGLLIFGLWNVIIDIYTDGFTSSEGFAPLREYSPRSHALDPAKQHSRPPSLVNNLSWKQHGHRSMSACWNLTLSLFYFQSPTQNKRESQASPHKDCTLNSFNPKTGNYSQLIPKLPPDFRDSVCLSAALEPTIHQLNCFWALDSLEGQQSQELHYPIQIVSAVLRLSIERCIEKMLHINPIDPLNLTCLLLQNYLCQSWSFPMIAHAPCCHKQCSRAPYPP